MMQARFPKNSYEGHVDGVRNGHLVGWGWYPDRPADVATVEVVLDGKVIASGQADRKRADLEKAGKRSGLCAFEIELPEFVFARVGDVLAVRLKDGSKLLPAGIEIADAWERRLATPAVEASIALPAALGGSGVEGCLDQFGPHWISGWARYPLTPNETVRFLVTENGAPVAEFSADQWRDDLAELRQGDGRGAFRTAIPAALRDGKKHEIKLDLIRGGERFSVLKEPLNLTFDERADARGETGSASEGTVVHETPGLEAGTPEITFIINFYNMPRESARTLRSLSRTYQRGVEKRAYEVLCVDNGSDPPMDADWVRSFGPEFRLFRPSKVLSSPCHAINEAARAAKGRHLAIMIDGAHVLTPGVLREAFEAIDADPSAVVAVRYWFVGGDQRWFGESSYTREMEDLLFAKISWPNDGYDLFRVGVPIGESASFWFDGLIESNCLFVPASLFESIGGMDEQFLEGGGGYANLDLFKRVVAAASGPPICLVGEATFHQFHGGTTTNPSVEAAERKVRSYEYRYRVLRGGAFEGVRGDQLRLRGSASTPRAFDARQRSTFPAALGVTDRTRAVGHYLDPGTRLFMQTIYAEAGPETRSSWLGQQISVAPGDLINIQEILVRLRPARILTNTSDEGLLGFVENVLGLLDLQDCRIVRIGNVQSAKHSARQYCVPGNIKDSNVRSSIDAMLGSEYPVLVLFAAPPDDTLPIDALRYFSQYVSFGSYIIYLGSVFGQPWLGYSKNWHRKAIQLLLEEDHSFARDRTLEKHILTYCPDGYLQRARPRYDGAYDPALDNLDGFEETP